MRRWRRFNPLVVTKTGELLCDRRANQLRRNSLFRHKDIESLADETQEKTAGRAGEEGEPDYIALDGTIGCLVNGAGLAMATMDIINCTERSPRIFWTSAGA